MKHTFLILSLLLLTTAGFSQSKKSQIKATTDTLWRFLNNTNGSGTATFGFITGSDTTFIQSDGTTLNFISTELLHNGEPIANNAFWLYEVITSNENNFTIPFALKATTTVFCNGVKTSKWTGIGTTILVLNLSTRQYDLISINQ